MPKRDASSSSAGSLVMASWRTTRRIEIMARRPLFSSESCFLANSSSDRFSGAHGPRTKYAPGVQSSFILKKVESLAPSSPSGTDHPDFLMVMDSMAPMTSRERSRRGSSTGFSSVSWKAKRLNSHLGRSGKNGWKSSERRNPGKASMATRPCLSSASRNLTRSALLARLEKLKGSKPSAKGSQAPTMRSVRGLSCSGISGTGGLLPRFRPPNTMEGVDRKAAAGAARSASTETTVAVEGMVARGGDGSSSDYSVTRHSNEVVG
mmetsp:Transcript_28657/g.83798  ORF Transcript_28657/g.83798 Transcript_28657/m.83798 type:complete len:264 (+) Transcript_28657:311-1102(+)